MPKKIKKSKKIKKTKKISKVMTKCDLCGNKVIKAVECQGCETKFCNHCGDQDRQLCNDCVDYNEFSDTEMEEYEDSF